MTDATDATSDRTASTSSRDAVAPATDAAPVDALSLPPPPPPPEALHLSCTLSV